MIEVRHLRLVQAINDAGSMHRAAARLHLSQPAISRQLSAIEKRLGVQLFLRLPRLMLTPAGEELLAAARVILERLEAAERKVMSVGRGASGILRLSTECNTCYQWLPQRLARFQRSHPDVYVEIVVEATPNPLPWLFDGRLDLAIVSSEPVSSSCEMTPLFKDEMIAIVSPHHPLAQKKHVSPADFANERLFVYNSPAESNRIFQHVLTPAGVRPRQVTPVPLTEATIEMVKQDLGVAVLARWAVARELAAKTLIGLRVTERGFWRRWEAAHLRGAPTPPYLDEFIRLLACAPFSELERRTGRRSARER